MAKVAKDKWDKVIEYLTHSDRDPEKVLNLLKGCDQGKLLITLLIERLIH